MCTTIQYVYHCRVRVLLYTLCSIVQSVYLYSMYFIVDILGAKLNFNKPAPTLVPLEHMESMFFFLAALRSSRSIVVWRSVCWSVCPRGLWKSDIYKSSRLSDSDSSDSSDRSDSSISSDSSDSSDSDEQ